MKPVIDFNLTLVGYAPPPLYQTNSILSVTNATVNQTNGTVSTTINATAAHTHLMQLKNKQTNATIAMTECTLRE